MQSIQCSGSSFLLKYFPTLFCLIFLWCLSLWAWLSTGQYLMGGWPPSLHPTSRGGNVPQTMSSARHDLISSSTQYLSTFTYTSLSSGYLTSSSTTHGPIPIFRPSSLQWWWQIWVTNQIFLDAIKFFIYNIRFTIIDDKRLYYQWLSTKKKKQQQQQYHMSMIVTPMLTWHVKYEIWKFNPKQSLT